MYTNNQRRQDKHFVNRGELSIIKEIVTGCLGMGIDDVMVTTPYKQQERMLQLHIHIQLFSFITESKVGSHRVISLTEDGKHAFKFLNTRP